MLSCVPKAGHCADHFYLIIALHIAVVGTISPEGIERQWGAGFENEHWHGVAIIRLRTFNNPDADDLRERIALIAIGVAKDGRGMATHCDRRSKIVTIRRG